MKVLVTGANGFIGRNLVVTLKNVIEGKDRTRAIDNNIELFLYDIDTPLDMLDEFCQKCDFVFHLAGVNRPDNVEDFMKGNFGFTSVLLDSLKKYNNKAPVLVTSSIQAALDNPYGLSKRAGEDLIFEYGKEYGVKTYVFRLPNVFGKWCRPNYNSAVATFCYNIANNLPITVNDRLHCMTLVYIDDVVKAFIDALTGSVSLKDCYCYVPVEYSVTLGEIVDMLYEFKEAHNTKFIPDMTGFSKKLYSTYLSYLPQDDFLYDVNTNFDNRGSFTEIFKFQESGQVSINVSKPGFVKGNHWHHTKIEKFVVVSGRGVIRLRKIDEDKIYEYHVSGEKFEIVDIPVGYTHNIENTGDADLITVIWCNECFDPNNPDTYFLEV